MTKDEIRVGDLLRHKHQGHITAGLMAKVVSIETDKVCFHWTNGVKNCWADVRELELVNPREEGAHAMPLFDVAFTVQTFKKLPDDSQIKVEKLLGKVDGIVAVSPNAAIAAAALLVNLPEGASEEELNYANVIVREMK